MFLPGRAIEKIMFVANDQNEVAKMTVNFNGVTVEQTFPPYEPSVTRVNLPESTDGGYDYRNYKYHDENGDLIEGYE